jgi:two-component system, LytTR family, sensor kinase
MNKKTVLYLIHIPVWIIAVLVAYFFSSDDFPAWKPNYVLFSTITFAIWFIASFYTFYSHLVPKYLGKVPKKAFWIYAALFVIIIIPVVVLALMQVTQVAALSLSDSLSGKGLFPWLGTIGGTIFCGVLGTLYRFSIDWFNNLNLRKELENTKLRGELNAIRSKLNPHFLFNTLNNIDALIQSDPVKASAALATLSDLLRYVVYETEKEKISIQKEIDIISQYIDIEKIRLSNPDSVSFYSSVSKDIEVPPAIFLPFIENGFKHSNLNSKGQKFDISITYNNNELLFNCINTVIGKKEVNNNTGIGIKLVRKRLELLYPGKHNLEIHQTDDEYSVTLKIDISDD